MVGLLGLGAVGCGSQAPQSPNTLIAQRETSSTAVPATTPTSLRTPTPTSAPQLPTPTAATVTTRVAPAPATTRPAPSPATTRTVPATPPVPREPVTVATPPAPAGVYFANCTAARAAGAAPVLRGQPGYRPALDRDGDGIGCET